MRRKGIEDVEGPASAAERPSPLHGRMRQNGRECTRPFIDMPRNIEAGSQAVL